jgi:uncharacterized phage-associated protein
MISALDVAWFFVQQSSQHNPVTQLKLQKLVYYAQGFYISEFGQPLFVENILPWDYGPLVRELRDVHKNKGASVISPEEAPFGEVLEDASIRKFLDGIWVRFGCYTAGELVDMTHAESPWKNAYKNNLSLISLDSMKAYFSGLSLSEIPTRDQNYTSYENLKTKVFLKGGVTKELPLSEADSFLLRNSALVERRKLPTRGPRRRAEAADVKDAV